MKKWYKIIDGERVWFKEPLVLDGVQYWNNIPDELMQRAGWTEYVAPAPSPAQLLEEAKRDKESEIRAYNDSEAVNAFFINGIQQEWLTPAQRVNYRQTVEAAQRKGMTEIPFLGYVIPVSVVLSALDDLDIYAWMQTACCERCVAEMKSLETIEAVEAYDYESQFALTEKPNFTISL